MYKINYVQHDRYPWSILHLLDLTTGEEKYWLFTVVYEDDLCKEYNVRDLTGLLLDKLPTKGMWTTKEEIQYL